MINEKKQKAGNDLTLRERINSGITRNWKLFTIVIAGMILVMVGIMILSFIQEKRRNASAELSEEIQELYDDWILEEAEDRENDSINTLIDRALDEYPRHFAAQKALFIRSKMAYEEENWAGAVKDFDELARRWPKSYLAPVSLFNSASAKEQAGNIEDAEQTFYKIIELYAETSPLIPEVYFNLGRIAESVNEVDSALEKYNEIISAYPGSRWTDLSRNRIILLKNQSLKGG